MNAITTIISFIKSEGAAKFISVCRTLFDLLLYYISGGKDRVNKIIEAGEKYRETKDVSILDNLINK